jgi:GPH family glycoside/pentoside/hexuronide:cation symporter
MEKKQAIDGNGKVPRPIKLLYGTGSIADTIMANILVNLSMPIYNIGLGLSAVWVGFGLGIPRILEAIANPIVGNISDNSHSRFGRRRQYIFGGAVLSGIIFILMWMPPASLSNNGLFVYFFIASLIFFAGYAVFTIPYGSLGIELTGDYHERTRVMAYKVFFANIGGLLTSFSYNLCFVFGHGKEVTGVRYVGFLFGAIIIISGIVPAIFCREKAQVQFHEPVRIGKALKHTLSNKPFLILSISMVIFGMSMYIMGTIGVYVGISHVFNGNKEGFSSLQIWMSIAFGVAGMLWSPVIAFIGTHLGKKNAFLLSLSLCLMGVISSWFLYNPANPYLMIIQSVLVSIGNCGAWVMSSSILGDICDLDEFKSGLRREGMFSAVFAFVFKIGFGLVLILAGFIVQMSGYNTAVSIQADQTNMNMRLVFVILPSILGIAAMAVFWQYSITQEQFKRIKSIINRRKDRLNQKLNPA